MAGLLVRLKLRLLRNALKSSRQARGSFIASCIAACLVAVGVFIALAAMRGQAAAVDLTTTMFTTFAFGWLILPLLVFGLDSTLDPATLALYPLRTRPLAVGLLAASATGAWPLANVIGLLGITVGLAHGALGVLFAVLAVLLQVLFCIVLARAVTTGLAGLLRSRRGKDFAGLLIIPIFALYETFAQLVPRLSAEGKITASSFNGVDKVLRWTPPGLAAHAVQDASTGHALAGLARLLLLAAVIVLLGWLWIRSLSKALVTADTTTQAANVRSTALPLARRGLRGTVAARSWIYQRREPGAKIFWGLIAIITIATSVGTILSPAWFGGLLSSAGAGAVFLTIFNANAIGMTGPAFGFDAMALHGAANWRAYFGGLDLALAGIALPLFGLISFALATIAKHPVYGFVGLAVNLAGIGAALGLSNMLSVALPYPVEKRPGNPTPKAIDGFKGQVLGAALGGMLSILVLIAPAVLAAIFTQHVAVGVRMPVLIVACAIYGLVLALLGVRLASRAAADRLPELCEVAFRSRL